MSETYEELRERYADSIWLRSETTYLKGPIRNSFDPAYGPLESGIPYLQPEERYEVTLTTPSGKWYTVVAYGQVDFLLFDDGRRLLVFKTIFGERMTDFAVVTDRFAGGSTAELEDKRDGETKNLRRLRG